MLIEASDGNFDGQGNRNGYFSYTVNPVTAAMPIRDRKFTESPLQQPTPGLYEIAESYRRIDGRRSVTTWTLSQDGKLYASWTMLQYFWSANGGINIGWTCFAPGSPEAGGKLPHRALAELILK